MEQKVDVVGYSTLEAFSDAPRFNQWLYDTISFYVGESVVEIGSGIGNITSCIKANKIFATDFSEWYLGILRNRFANNSAISVKRLDASNKADFEQFNGEYIDTILCSNVLEHIKDDDTTVQNFYNMLAPRGTLILLVPFSQKLFCDYDRELGHYRRYSRSTIRKVVEDNGFKAEKIFLFNFFGGIGWFVMGKLLRRKHLTNKAIGLYEKCVPLFRALEKFGVPFGASIICIARKY